MTKRILVVEDRDDSRAILVTILRRLCGYETIEAANGTEAIEKAASEEPDLILMDLDLPEHLRYRCSQGYKGKSKNSSYPDHCSNGLEFEAMEK